MLVRNQSEAGTVTYDDAQGAEMRPVITKDDGAPGFAMRVFTLQPEGHTPYHSHAWEHEVYILDGTGVVRSADGERRVRAGDAVFVAPHELHQFRAGAAGLRFICCAPHH